jgi:hypothetical protein
MLPGPARFRAVIIGLVAILAFISEAQARHWGLWGSFGYWGQGHYEARHLRSSANESEADDSPLRFRGFSNRGSPLGAAVAELMKACFEGAGKLQHWPNDSIAQLIAPDENQSGVLEQLRGNAGKQAEILRAACPRDIPADPVAQVNVSNNVVDGMLAAITAVLPSIESFYATLGDEQKARLVAESARVSNVNEDQLRARHSVRHPRRTEGTSDQSGMCEQWGRALLDWPRRRIDRDIRLSDVQRTALSELISSSNQAADILGKSCPADISLTPVGHLQAMRQQLETVGRTIQAVRPALGNFYETLNDEQKRRFAATN